MSDCLVITDLNYLECSKGIEIVGGDVSTFAYTSAGSGSAFAYANASAYGQSTNTDTKAKTLTQDYRSATYSYAKASATANASDNGINQKSFYRSTSVYYSGH